MTIWADIITEVTRAQTPVILVTVGAAWGSTPRETGTRMLVSGTGVLGTIGGGQLEYVAIDVARNMLRAPDGVPDRVMKLPLGPELAQCCGGYTELLLSSISMTDISWLAEAGKLLIAQEPAVLATRWDGTRFTRHVVSAANSEIYAQGQFADSIATCCASGQSFIDEDVRKSDEFTLFEPLDENRFHLTLFGAGHVGKAIVHTLAPLPCQITWIDPRADEFPSRIPGNVKKIIAADPVTCTKTAPAGSYFLVMTHSHQLDFELTAALLGRKDNAYLGLIGSVTKQKRFFKRLLAQGYTNNDLAKITCPIGIPALTGKHPTEIAISVATQIMQQQKARQKNSHSNVTGSNRLNMQAGQ